MSEQREALKARAADLEARIAPLQAELDAIHKQLKTIDEDALLLEYGLERKQPLKMTDEVIRLFRERHWSPAEVIDAENAKHIHLEGLDRRGSYVYGTIKADSWITGNLPVDMILRMKESP